MMTNLQRTDQDLLSEFLAPLLLDLPADGQTCRWVIGHDADCGETIPTNRRLAFAHLRKEHAIGVGDASGIVSCQWQDCHVQRPMRRACMLRHVMEVHLKLMRWDCSTCGKTLSRRSKSHRCLRGVVHTTVNIVQSSYMELVSGAGDDRINLEEEAVESLGRPKPRDTWSVDASGIGDR